jgi:hypothetical protein
MDEVIIVRGCCEGGSEEWRRFIQLFERGWRDCQGVWNINLSREFKTTIV